MSFVNYRAAGLLPVYAWITLSTVWSLTCMTIRRLHVTRFFFFSSRRRHTRCLSDWSSDVCSSDLFLFGDGVYDGFVSSTRQGAYHSPRHAFDAVRIRSSVAGYAIDAFAYRVDPSWRSEERRVGKECRSRWSPYH